VSASLDRRAEDGRSLPQRCLVGRSRVATVSARRLVGPGPARVAVYLCVAPKGRCWGGRRGYVIPRRGGGRCARRGVRLRLRPRPIRRERAMAVGTAPCDSGCAAAEPAAYRERTAFRPDEARALDSSMAPLSEERRTPRADDSARDEADAVVVAERLRAEMHSAVDSLRHRLPRAFPQWDRRRSEASQTARSERRQ
jgi:hypothetical protein